MSKRSKNKKQPEKDYETMADRMINAQLQIAIGEYVDEDWLLDSMS